MRILLLAMLLAGALTLHAQSGIEVVGTGDVGVITSNETVTGEIEVSDQRLLNLSAYLGMDDQPRQQGDWDVWQFEVAYQDNLIIEVVATDGDLVPTLAFVFESASGARIYARDYNLDGNNSAGMCFYSLSNSGPAALLVYRQPNTFQSGAYELTVTELTYTEMMIDTRIGTASCPVGSFAFARGDQDVPIYLTNRDNAPPYWQMPPGTPYSITSSAGAWTAVSVFGSGSRYPQGGWVRTSEIIISGTPELPASAEQERLPNGTAITPLRQLEVNIRAGAGTAFEVVGQLTPDDVAVVAGYEDGWYVVQFGEISGYVSETLVESAHP